MNHLHIMTEPQQREAVEEDSREKDGQVESKWPTQVTPGDEPSKLEEERPKTEPKQKDFTKKTEAGVPSSLTAVLVPELAPVQIKEEPPTTVEKLQDDVNIDDVKRMEAPNIVESKQTVEESKPVAADQQKAIEVAAKEVKGNGETKEPSPPKQVQQDEQPDTIPVSKLMKQDKPGELHLYTVHRTDFKCIAYRPCFTPSLSGIMNLIIVLADLLQCWYCTHTIHKLIFTPRTCTRGKVIGSVICLLLLLSSTQKLPDLDFYAS